ncbi:MAG TPA: AAA family ATPase [Vicinamibacteria bacterium]|nr:AAA family ATPase [Vicinamibacteria bacterium]
MYEEYFGLKKAPFCLTPDPSFLYQGAAHREALASLIYGVRAQRGFIALVGEPGTGKSTLIQTLLEDLHEEVRTALITHTTVDRVEILRMIVHELDIPDEGLGRVEMLRQLNELVIEELKGGRLPPLLIIDEAQGLSDEVLEEIRLLTNLEISGAKLLQVLLAGQPELESRLQSPRLRQLRQRIAVHAKLRPLARDEVAAYVDHRLRVAGGGQVRLFTEPALHAIWEASGGIPRLINALCDLSMMNAYGAEKSRVDLSLAEEAIRDTGLGPEQDQNVSRGFFQRLRHSMGRSLRRFRFWKLGREAV